MTATIRITIVNHEGSANADNNAIVITTLKKKEFPRLVNSALF
ncbi:hypothetical protein RHSA111115_14245 [Rheinheimera salexigens]